MLVRQDLGGPLLFPGGECVLEGVMDELVLAEPVACGQVQPG